MTYLRAFLTRLVSNPVLQCIVFLALLIGAGQFSAALVQILTFVLVSILFAQSINILTGMAGQISLGHAAFFGVGAYGTAILAKVYGLSLLMTIPVASIVSALLAYVLSFPAGRVREVYLAMMTLGFGQIFLEVAREWTDLTGCAH
jgi:ABC-type branched-subunit amino acid transport system permease subunit